MAFRVLIIRQNKTKRLLVWVAAIFTPKKVWISGLSTLRKCDVENFLRWKCVGLSTEKSSHFVELCKTLGETWDKIGLFFQDVDKKGVVHSLCRKGVDNFLVANTKKWKNP